MIKRFILNKKIITGVILAALLFAGIIALTQELDVSQSESKEEKKEEKKDPEAEKSPVVRVPEKPMRWFRSNAGGMALEELGTRFTALRNEYALAIDYSPYHDIPGEILSYNKSDFTTEIRTLYKKADIIRTQWIFRDKNGTTRLNAVFIEQKKAEVKPQEKPAAAQPAAGGEAAVSTPEAAGSGTAETSGSTASGGDAPAGSGQEANQGAPAAGNGAAVRGNMIAAISNTVAAVSGERAADKNGKTADNNEKVADNSEKVADNSAQSADNSVKDSDNSGQADAGQTELASSAQPAEEKPAEIKPVEKKPAQNSNSPLIGFIEIFDEKGFLTSETRLYEDGSKDRIEYTAKDNLIISATVFSWDKEKKEVTASYTDYYRYNRSLSLRGVEREFFKDMMNEDEPLLIAFPRNLMDAVNEQFFQSQRENIVPEFFGDVFVKAESKIVYESDDRGRIIRQTLYDENEKVIWVIKNTWLNDRITSTIKTEGDNEFTARFEYNAGGEKVVERNYKNGVLERVVRTTGKTDIEELYFNNILVLKAVWEDGRKISEERVR